MTELEGAQHRDGAKEPSIDYGAKEPGVTERDPIIANS